MELEKLMQWLSTYPGFQGMCWETDCLPHKPNMATLTPKGIRVLKEREDLLGNRKKTLQFTCTLAFSGSDQAQSLLKLQHWVQTRPAPDLGQGKTELILCDGRHLTKNKLGLDLYTAQLKLTYEICYEENENGEN